MKISGEVKSCIKLGIDNQIPDSGKWPIAFDAITLTSNGL